MINHIEQLMKAAGVECSTMCKPIGANCKAGCDNCERREVFYPSFTPEKQLELIKLIGKKLISLNYKQIGDFHIMQVNTQNRYCGIYKESDTFDALLADMVVELIKLCELDKLEVKKILED